MKKGRWNFHRPLFFASEKRDSPHAGAGLGKARPGRAAAVVYQFRQPFMNFTPARHTRRPPQPTI
jgi:hypothetical protein